MTKNNVENAQSKFIVPDSVAALADAMQGMPGAKTILKDLGQEALKAGVIVEEKVNSATPQPEVPIVDTKIENAENNSQVANNGNGGNIEKKPENNAENNNQQASENDVIEHEEYDPILGKVKTTFKKGEFASDIKGLGEFVKKEYGQEISDFPQLQKFLKGSVAEWRAQAQKARELSEQVQKYEGIFDSMPEDLLNGVKSFFEGDSDWKSKVVNASKIDFSKPLSEISSRELIEYYFPGEFDDEDFKAEEKPKAILLAEKAAKDKFNIDKKSREEMSAKQIRDAEARQTARKTSVASSLTSLKESFPSLDASVEKQVKSVLESGDISSLFFNKDGSVKPDAAEKLMMAMHGKKTVYKLVSIASKKAETATNEDILTRGADERKEKTSSSQGQQTNDKIMKEIDSMFGGLNKKKTY